MLRTKNLWLYRYLSQFRVLRSYRSKIMAIAFLGTHVPLLTLLFCFIVSASFSWSFAIQVLGIALLATLIGTALTLYALNNLLAPVVLTSRSLRNYIETNTLPALPTAFTDEVGTLMGNTVHTVQKLDDVIHYMARHDDLTGLPNYTLLVDRLEQALATAEQQHLEVAAFSISNLESIYNAFGHEISESWLRAIAHRLSLKLDESVMVAYLGNSIFAAIYAADDADIEQSRLAKKILGVLQEPFIINEQVLYAHTQVGISLYPHDGTHANCLLQHASAAMDQAKQAGNNLYQFYSAQMNSKLQEHLRLENELRCAIAKNELQLYYQPRVEAQTGRMVGVEALLRWHSPTRGWISPGQFIPIAEASGLIVPLGEWVLKTACHQNQVWRAAGLPRIRMSVNLSADQLKQDSFVETVHQILTEANLEAEALELEVTESLMMENLQHSIEILQTLQNMGITIALDDFGTGYSSLSYLRRFPIDTLKIDRSFVSNVMSDAGDAAITKTIIALAKNLQLSITAEGVETSEQCAYIQEQGCDEIQGYYFSRPLPADQLMELLQKGANLSPVMPETTLAA